MNCDPKALLAAAKCYQCLPKNVWQSAIISLLCEWANNKNGRFSYEPESANMQWHDSNGIKSGNLAYFYANADLASVDTVVIIGNQGVTSVTNISFLTALLIFGCNHNSVTELDFTGCSNVFSIQCGFNLLGTVTLTGCTSLVLFYADHNPALVVIP